MICCVLLFPFLGEALYYVENGRRLSGSGQQAKFPRNVRPET